MQFVNHTRFVVACRAPRLDTDEASSLHQFIRTWCEFIATMPCIDRPVAAESYENLTPIGSTFVRMCRFQSCISGHAPLILGGEDKGQ